MPKLRDEDRVFAERLGNVLRQLRDHAGWTRAKAEEEIGVSAETLGKWERGDNAPKGYDLGRLYRAYAPFGADWRWFLDPPEVVVTDPVRDELERQRDERQREARALAREDLAAEQEGHRAAATQRAARRRRQPA